MTRTYNKPIYFGNILRIGIILLILLRFNDVLKYSKIIMTESHINILGKKIELVKRPPDKLKGINMGEKLTFDFFDGLFRGENMLFVKPKGSNPTPRKCAFVSRFLPYMQIDVKRE